jgi:polyisoprenoid-binding protein YceI
MKIEKGFLIAVLCATVGLMGFGLKKTTNYGLVTKKSTMEWKGKKLGGQHVGTVDLKSGSFSLKDDVVTTGSFVIDMTTLVPTDLKGNDKKKLTRHLRGEDFFNVSKHPTATLAIKESKSTGDKLFDVTADLTILGKTKEITFPAKILGTSRNFIIVSANISFDRTKWGITYKSSLVADALIRDNIDMKIKLFGKKEK